MNILFVNENDSKGGAAIIARNIFKGVKEFGYSSKFLVQNARSKDEDTHSLPIVDFNKGRLQRFFTDPHRFLNDYLGIENTHNKKVFRWLRGNKFGFDLLHLHNLHLNYFGLNYLPEITSRYPVVLTLHDTWLMTGHCAYFIQCQRWKTGCGNCPDLRRYSPVRRDKTAFNWRKKAGIFKRSHLYLVGPSKWVVDCAEQSMLSPAIRKPQVIRNGIDLNVFSPGNRDQVRQELGLPLNKLIVLFVANGIVKSYFKDYPTFEGTFKWISDNWQESKKVLFVGLGEDDGVDIQHKGAELILVPKISDLNIVAKYYQAADVYFHSARADNFPTTILEAMGCGLPVVATNVGGIPEQVRDGQTGYLAEFENPKEHAQKLMKLLKNESLRKEFGSKAVTIARKEYDQKYMVLNYIEYYQAVVDDWKSSRKSH